MQHRPPYWPGTSQICESALARRKRRSRPVILPTYNRARARNRSDRERARSNFIALAAHCPGVLRTHWPATSRCGGAAPVLRRDLLTASGICLVAQRAHRKNTPGSGANRSSCRPLHADSPTWSRYGPGHVNSSVCEADYKVLKRGTENLPPDHSDLRKLLLRGSSAPVCWGLLLLLCRVDRTPQG
jgi:hypothetical protein